jgi:hypothetical protein
VNAWNPSEIKEPEYQNFQAFVDSQRELAPIGMSNIL